LEADESNSRVVSLAETAWARLLFALLSQRFSGRAEVEQEGVRRQVVFRGGFAVWTDVAVEGTGLSEILASAGMLSPDEAEQLRVQAPDDSLEARSPAAALAGVEEEAVTMALRDQCEQRLVAVAGLGGELSLHDEPGLPADVLEGLSPARTLRVINQAVRRFCSPVEAHAALEHLADTPLAIGRAYSQYGERFDFDHGERTTLKLLSSRGSFSLDDLQTISGLDEVRGSQILYTLWACNMLVEAGSEPDAPAEPVAGGRSEVSLVQDLVIAKIEANAPPYDILALKPDATLADIDAAVEDLRRKVEGQGLDASLVQVRDAARARRGVAAEVTARKALGDRRWARAVTALRDAASLSDDPAVVMDLAWARWNAEERRGESVARELDEAATACADATEAVQARAQFYRGHLRKHQGRAKEALAAFDRAAELDSKLIDAQREARALRGGGGASEKPAPKPKKSSKSLPPPTAGETKPRHKYWSGPWPIIWVLTGLLLAALVAAQFMLRLDVEY
jgi:tetratricopeptide (TPR) repeat protein